MTKYYIGDNNWLIGKWSKFDDNVFTPPALARKIVNLLNWSDTDCLDFLESTNLGIVDIGAKLGNLLVAFAKRATQAIENTDYSVTKKDALFKTLRNKLWALPATSVTAFYMETLFHDNNWNMDNILYPENAGQSDTFGLDMVRLTKIYHENPERIDNNGNTTLSQKTRLLWEKHFENIANMQGVGEVSNEEIMEMVKVLSSGTFDVAVGNPPYQNAEAGEGTGATATYHYFMQTAQLAANTVSLIYPSRWLTGGRGEGIDAFRNQELSSENYVSFILDPSPDIFDTITVEGGINYFLWEKDRTGTTQYFYADEPVEERATLLNKKTAFIREPRFSEILDKVDPQTVIKPVTGYYGQDLHSEPKVNMLIEQVTKDTETAIVYYSGNSGGIRTAFVPADATEKTADHYKVFVSVTAHPKQDSLRRPNRILMGEPGEICSSSYAVFADLPTREAAENLIRYLKTDLATFLLGIITPTQHAYAKVYRLIPEINPVTGEITDRPGTFLDFSKDLDEQLFAIYDFNEYQQEIVTSSIRPWRDKNSVTADGLY